MNAESEDNLYVMEKKFSTMVKHSIIDSKTARMRYVIIPKESLVSIVKVGNNSIICFKKYKKNSESIMHKIIHTTW